MSDLILSWSYYHRHTAIYAVQLIDTILRPYVSFTGFACYIAVRGGFDKHLYMTSRLNAQSDNTCIRLPQTRCIARKMAVFIISQDR